MRSLCLAIGILMINSAAIAAPGAQIDQDRAAAIRAAVAKVGPSIVTIETIGGTQPSGQPRAARRPTTQPSMPRFGHGGFRVADGPTSGMVWSADGLIVTSAFNFVRDPTIITVVMSNGRRFVAKLLARDMIRRIALLKVEANDLPVPEWTPNDEIRVGQFAIACGRGFGGTLPSVSVGMVSALGRRAGNAIQTDAKLSPANYGGPLVDLDGRVLGVCVPLAGGGGELAGVEWYDSGIGFAIPRDRIEAVASRLMGGTDIEPGRIGVVLGLTSAGEDEEGEDAPAEPRRVKITMIADPSPALKAGLKPEDIILSVDGKPVGEIGELQRRLSDTEAGTEVTLSIDRDGTLMDIKLTLARIADIGEPRQPGARPTSQPSTQPAG